MEQLFLKHRKKIQHTDLTFIRNFHQQIHWKDRMIGIKGGRGVGKTTLILQHIKKNFIPGADNLYVSLDDVYFAGNSLVDFVEEFIKYGGKHLFLDEVHRYPNWSQELKNLYDDFPELHVVFTGSSILDILQSKADLSRRAIIYQMQGFSFREFLAVNGLITYEPLTLGTILEDHQKIADEINHQIKPLPEFQKYLEGGYYPFFLEYPETYHQRLEQVVNLVLETDIPALKPVNIEGVHKIKQLLYVVSTSVPFKPNINKISEKTGISRNSIVQYLQFLNDAEILNLLFRDTHGLSLLQKPEKIYFENSNLIYTLSSGSIDSGNVRETFFINQLKSTHQVNYTDQGDFLVDGNYHFEVGGKNKSWNQIKDLNDAFLALDGIEFGFRDKIPLWMFGFLY
jgi:predicted AAA+ superfamily ATPase